MCHHSPLAIMLFVHVGSGIRSLPQRLSYYQQGENLTMKARLQTHLFLSQDICGASTQSSPQMTATNIT